MYLPGELVIRAAGAQDDPVGVVAIFFWQPDRPSKGRSCLQLQGVAAACGVECFLQVVTFFEGTNVAGRRRVRQGAVDVNPRQFGGAVKRSGAMVLDGAAVCAPAEKARETARAKPGERRALHANLEYSSFCPCARPGCNSAPCLWDPQNPVQVM